MRWGDTWAMTVLMCLFTQGCRVSSAAPARPTDAPAVVNASAGGTDASPAAASLYAKPPLADLRRKLTPIQFEVTQNAATEPPFQNDFWDNHAPGIYVDVATGEPLFSSLDKFESGTGWPSFTRPIEDGHVVSIVDSTLGMTRTEVRSSAGASHLGHVFDDGPPPTGLRFCINSAALRFIPVAGLAAAGYSAYAARFAGSSPTASAPVASSNSCASPPPGARAGCAATLDTALLSGDATTQEQLRSLPGVLEVEAGAVGGANALRVVFDPKQIAYADLLRKWAVVEQAGAGTDRVAYAMTDEQRRAAQKWMTHAGSPAGSRPRGVVVRGGDANAFTPSAH